MSSRPSLSEWLNAEEAAGSFQALSQDVWRRVRKFFTNPLGVAGLFVVVLLLVTAAIGPTIAPYSPIDQNLSKALIPPGGEYILGTDELGRDIASRILYGCRITLTIIFIVTVTVGPIGLTVGCLAGYLGGWVDLVLMRVTELFLSFPSLILAMAFVAALGPNLQNAIIAIALSNWPPVARLARAEAMSLRNRDHISAVKLMGASKLRIVFLHIAPLCLPTVVVRMTLNMASVILTAAGLGFLGLGAQPPIPEWGAMVSTGRRVMMDSWWVVTMPGLAILLVSVSFNLIGDALRDALDPRQE